jgi:cytochrome P450
MRWRPVANTSAITFDGRITAAPQLMCRTTVPQGRRNAGSRAIDFYGAANRDERKYPHPDRFDVLRRPGDHLGFAAGPHACVGMNLARIEMVALFTELAKRVRRFTILEEKRILNNVLRGFKALRITVSRDS